MRTRRPNRANRKSPLPTRISCGILVCMHNPPPHTAQIVPGANPCRARRVAQNSWRCTRHSKRTNAYPQRRETYLFFAVTPIYPSGLIVLDGSGSISFDVLSWLAEQKVSFIRIDWKGDIVCVAGASGYSANPFRVRWQLETRENPKQRNDFSRSDNYPENRSERFDARKSNSRSDKWERAMKSAYAALSHNCARKLGDDRGYMVCEATNRIAVEAQKSLVSSIAEQTGEPSTGEGCLNRGLVAILGAQKGRNIAIN